MVVHGAAGALADERRKTARSLMKTPLLITYLPRVSRRGSCEPIGSVMRIAARARRPRVGVTARPVIVVAQRRVS